MKHWIPFVADKFREGKRTASEAMVREICELTHGHPFYTQHLCHVLWELCEPGKAITAPLIQEAVGILLDRENYAYVELWESLALNQRRLLKGLASEPSGAKPFAGAFVRRHGLGSSSSSQRAVEALLNRDVIDRDNGSFLITDRFFRIWIQRRQLQAQARFSG